MEKSSTPLFEFDVPDMSCGHCVGAITRAIKDLDATADVQCDLPAHKVRVRTQQPRGEVVDALAEAGYPPG